METLGSRVRTLRQQKNLSMIELAKQIKVPSKYEELIYKPLTPTTIGNIENDKHSPNSEIIIALSDFFNVSTDWLLTGKEFSERLVVTIEDDRLTNKDFDISYKEEIQKHLEAEIKKIVNDAVNEAFNKRFNINS